MPILCSSAPDVSPGWRSTMNALNLSPSTFANTMKMSANPPLVIHIFSPLRMYSLPSSLKRAVALAAIASEPSLLPSARRP